MFFFPLFDENATSRRPVIVWLIIAACVFAFFWQQSLDGIAAEVAILKSFKNSWFLLLFWRGGFAGEGVGDQRNKKAKVGRLKGDVGRFSGDLRGHKVPSEEAMGGPRGPLEGPRAVRGRQQDLCQ